MATIKYVVRKKKIIGGSGYKYYAQVAPVHAINRKEIAEYIMQNEQVGEAVVASAVDAILKSIENFVMNGHSVSIGDFGTFRVTLKSAGSATAEAVSAENVTGARIRFFPASNLKQALKLTNGAALTTDTASTTGA